MSNVAACLEDVCRCDICEGPDGEQCADAVENRLVGPDGTHVNMELLYRCFEFGVSKTSRCSGAEHRRGIGVTWHRSGASEGDQSDIRATFGVTVLCLRDKQRTVKKGRPYVAPERHRSRSDIGVASEWHPRGDIGVAPE